MNIQQWVEAGKPWNVILHGDCMDLMKHFDDKEIPLCIVDPPYGIGVNKGGVALAGNGNFKGGNFKVPARFYAGGEWDNAPDKKYFDELFRISKNQIIYGGNYFIEHLKNTSCFIVWDKDNGKSFQADCEIAWASFNSSIRIFKYRWWGLLQENMKEKDIRIHPTQKPVALYRWLIQNYAKAGDKIIDTHSGSGSLACACHLEKFDFLAIEKDADYHKSSVERLDTLRSQGVLF